MAAVSTPRVYRVGDIEVDAARGLLRRNGLEVHVKPKTFRILQYLLAARDRLVSREELMEEFWKGTAVTDDALAQCIAELRRALGDSARNPMYLRTVPKLGYRFVASVEENPSQAAAVNDAPSPELAKPSRRQPRWHWGATAAAALSVAAVFAVLAKQPKEGREPKYGEVAWWKLDEGDGTVIRDALHGAAVLPAGVSWIPGVSGSALRFTGLDTHVLGTAAGSMPRGAAPRTLTAWIRTSTTNGDATTFFQYGSARSHVAADAFFLLLHQTGRAAFGNYYRSVSSRHRLDDGLWHHVAGVVDQGRIRLVVDGDYQAEASVGETLDPGDVSNWAIGRAVWGGTSFRGDIDDIRVYERSLRDAEINGLYRCMSRVVDMEAEGRGPYYFASVFGDNVDLTPPLPGEGSTRVRNRPGDLGGIMFVRPPPDCAMQELRGSDVGQDLSIQVELRVPPGPGGEVTEAGPYFRCRRSAPGDGIVGGTSAGYWVQLRSTGQVRVRRLHPVAIVAYSETPQQFDPTVFHELEIAVKGEALEVTLDRRLVLFDQGGIMRSAVHIPPAWNTASPPGSNRGSAGIAFGSEPYRNRAGGQEARNIRLKPYRRPRED
ncbi:MAG: winged helix-turn-helix domain-containing protein [Bryobacteraceae bacterium]|nr:winged helix-turn-helix domain-containing protein [Bryobacteraceae bacterium]